MVLFLEKGSAAQVQARPFAGFSENFCLKRWNIWTKLGGNEVLAYPEGTSLLVLDLDTRGPSY